MSRTDRLILLCLAFPVLVLGLMPVYYAYAAKHAPVWHLRIEAYDPRDLLRGQYLQFRYSLPGSAEKQSCTSRQPCGLCLTRGADGYDTFTTALDDDIKTCDNFVTLYDPTSGAGSLIPGIAQMNLTGRYYLPEDKAHRIAQLLADQDAHVFAVDATLMNNRLTPTQLYIDDMKWSDFLETEPAEDLQP